MNVTDSNSQKKKHTLEKENDVPLKLLLSYGVGHVINDVTTAIWFTYVLIYAHEVLKFNDWEAGFILLLAQISDAIFHLVVGYCSDRFGVDVFCGYGRRKSWHLIGSVMIVVSYPFCFSPCISCTSAPKWIQLVYYGAFNIIYGCGFAAVQNSHLSLLPELSTCKNGRTKLAAIRYTFTVLANIFAYTVTWAVFGLNSTNNQIGLYDATEFQLIAYICLVLGTLCSIIFHLTLKENNVNNETPAAQKEKQIKVLDVFGQIKHYQIIVVYMSAMVFNNMTQAFTPLYLHETLHMSNTSIAFVPLAIYLGSFAASFVVHKMNKAVGRKTAYLIGASIGLIACMCIQFGSMSNETTYEITAVAVLFGIGCSIMLITSVGLTADVIGEKTGSGAFIYGIICLTEKTANGIVPFVVEYLHKYYPIPKYYEQVLVCIGGGALVLGTTVVLTFTQHRTKNSENLQGRQQF